VRGSRTRVPSSVASAKRRQRTLALCATFAAPGRSGSSNHAGAETATTPARRPAGRPNGSDPASSADAWSEACRRTAAAPRLTPTVTVGRPGVTAASAAATSSGSSSPKVQ